MNWDTYFMSMAFLMAMKSKDEQTHNGTVIVGKGNEILSTGYNSFVRGAIDNLPERQERPEKYFHFEHSERNAIYNAARVGIKLEGARMYVTGVPCMDCARAIVQVGIEECITTKWHTERMQGRWNEHMDRTLQLFKEVGLHHRFYEGEYIHSIASLVQGIEYKLGI